MGVEQPKNLIQGTDFIKRLVKIRSLIKIF